MQLLDPYWFFIGHRYSMEFDYVLMLELNDSS